MGSTAVISTYQRTPMPTGCGRTWLSIRRGIFGDGIAASIAGVLGTYGLTLATANTGLVVATGVASRKIAFVIAAILAVGAVQPGFIALLTHHATASDGVRAAVYGGVHHDQRRADHLDPGARSRRTLVVGMGMMAFFIDSVFPAALSRASRPGRSPLWARRWCWQRWSRLTLNGLFRLGIRRKVTMSVDPAAAGLPGGRQFRSSATRRSGAPAATSSPASSSPCSRERRRSSIIAGRAGRSRSRSATTSSIST